MKRFYFYILTAFCLIAALSFTEVSETGGGSYMICDAKNSNECKIETQGFVIYATGDGHFGKTK